MKVKVSPIQMTPGSKMMLSVYIDEVGTRGGMHNEDVPLGSDVMPILVAAQCY